MRISTENCKEIVGIVNDHWVKFVDRSFGKGIVRSDNRVSELSTLYEKDMSADLLQVIYKSVPFEWRYDVQEIQIQRYEKGGSISLHREGPNIQFLDLSVLYSEVPTVLYVYDKSEGVWSTVEDDIGFIRRVKPDIYHCVPHVYGLRYSIVFIRYRDYSKGFTYVRCI